MAYVIQDIYTGELNVDTKQMFERRKKELENKIIKHSVQESVHFLIKELIKVENEYKLIKNKYQKVISGKIKIEIPIDFLTTANINDDSKITQSEKKNLERINIDTYKFYYKNEVLDYFEYFINYLKNEINIYGGLEGIFIDKDYEDISKSVKEKNKNKVYALLELNKLDWQSYTVDLMRFIVLIKCRNIDFEKIEPIKLLKKYCTKFGDKINPYTIKQNHSSVMKEYSPNNNYLKEKLIKKFGYEGFVRNEEIISNFLKLHI